MVVDRLRAGGDLARAISMYNAGPRGSRQDAETYLQAVITRYDETFVQRDRFSPTRYLLLRYAEPAYFRKVDSDLLFKRRASQKSRNLTEGAD